MTDFAASDDGVGAWLSAFRLAAISPEECWRIWNEENTRVLVERFAKRILGDVPAEKVSTSEYPLLMSITLLHYLYGMSIPENITKAIECLNPQRRGRRPLNQEEQHAEYLTTITQIIPRLVQRLGESWQRRCCIGCGRVATSPAEGALFKACGSCAGRFASYCSKACQTLDWKAGHKAVCLALREQRLRDGLH